MEMKKKYIVPEIETVSYGHLLQNDGEDTGIYGSKENGEPWAKENSVFDEGSESGSMEGGVEDFHYNPWED